MQGSRIAPSQSTTISREGLEASRSLPGTHCLSAGKGKYRPLAVCTTLAILLEWSLSLFPQVNKPRINEGELF